MNGEHTAPKMASHKTCEKHDVPLPELALAEPLSWPMPGGRTEEGCSPARQVFGDGVGSRVEVVLDLLHVPQLSACQQGRDRQLPLWGPCLALTQAAALICDSAFVPVLLLPSARAGIELGGWAGRASWKHTHGLPPLPRKH